jgi:phage shock protein A
MKVIVLSLFVLFAGPAWAEDSAATMAALKDTASECRYMKSLCERVAKGKARVDQLQKETEAAIAAAQGNVTHESVGAANIKQAGYQGAIAGTSQAMTACSQAENVLKSKHDKPPKCFRSCCD